MLMSKSEKVARAFAIDKNQPYGHSVFDGKWYVGTRDELAKVGAEPQWPALPIDVLSEEFRAQARKVAYDLALARGERAKADARAAVMLFARDAHARGHIAGSQGMSLECCRCGASCSIEIVDGKANAYGGLARGTCGAP